MNCPPAEGARTTPTLSPQQAHQRFATARVARLATVRPDGSPRVVPIVFALVELAGSTTLVSAVDHKPKRTTALARLADVAHEPRVSIVVDHYDDDWDALWWARADGTGAVLAGDDPQAAASLDALAARHPQYAQRRPGGPLLSVTVTRWTGWSALARS